MHYGIQMTDVSCFQVSRAEVENSEVAGPDNDSWIPRTSAPKIDDDLSKMSLGF